jgi:hypothetical protein
MFELMAHGIRSSGAVWGGGVVWLFFFFLDCRVDGKGGDIFQVLKFKEKFL